MNKTISLIVLASAALHVAVLGLIDFNSTPKIEIGSIMRVSIQAPSPAGIPNKAINSNRKIKHLTQNNIVKEKSKPVPEIIAKQATATKKSIPAEAIPSQELIDIPQEENTPVKHLTVLTKLELSSRPSTNSLPEHTASLLHSDLERAFALHFYYPRIAIKRGWQGEVKISLRIEADGYLTHVRLLNSSGYTLLDNAAMRSLDKVEILPAAVALLDGQSLNLVLPVEYHLL